MRWMAVCAACPTDAFGRVSVSWSLREGGEQLPDASRALWLRGFGRVHCVPGLITVLCDLIDRISLRVSLCVCKYERAKRFLMKYQDVYMSTLSLLSTGSLGGPPARPHPLYAGTREGRGAIAHALV